MATFDRFLAAFPTRSRPPATDSWSPSAVEGFDDLMFAYGGCTFELGLYRLHTPRSAHLAEAAVVDAFPELAGGIVCFGFDWLGREFAIDMRPARQRHVVLAEPGTGEILEIPTSFADFHNLEIVDEPDAALARSFFSEWSQSNPSSLPLAPDVCVGYNIPLFLGGRDEIANLSTVDVSVYWSIAAQLLRRVAGVAAGTHVSGITIVDE